MTDDVRAVLSGERRWAVVRGDSAEVLATLPPSSVDAVVCDPPAGIKFMNLAFDHDRGGRAQWVAWLAGILASARVATKDGGRMFAWALPRTSHWTGCAVEDAGWSIENVVTHLFATGWPKGSSQLKPASEHWWLARGGRSTLLNIDAARVNSGPSPSIERRASSAKTGWTTAGVRPSGIVNRTSPERYREPRPEEVNGRYPPNLVLSHAPGCVREGTRRVLPNGQRRFRTEFSHDADRMGYGGNDATFATVANPNVSEDGTEIVESWRCAEGCPVKELDAMAGDLPSQKTRNVQRERENHGAFGVARLTGGNGPEYLGETGGPSRFYPCFPADDPADPWNEALFRYVAKPSRAEKETGVADDVDRVSMETGFPGGACEATGQRSVKSVANSHPTVKPIALMRWLIRLITQPGDLVIDPFGGSGTTGAAALLEGRRVVIIEKERRFVDIARARCEHAAPTPERLARVATEPVRVVAPDYGPLFGGRP